MFKRKIVVKYFRGLILIFFCSSSIFFQGCFDYFDLLTAIKPKVEDVVGKYQLKTHTSGGLASLKGKACFIELGANGKFEAKNILPSNYNSFMQTSEEIFSKLINASGTWEIGPGAVNQTAWEIDFKSDSSKAASIYIMGKKPPYSLIYIVGDPDTCEVMIFEKAK
jgi:hypothetical protein